MSEITPWMLERLHPNAIPIAERLPPRDTEVWGWVSAPEVAIHHCPCAVRHDGHGNWWSGLPGNWLDLNRLKWTVTHWLPLKPPVSAGAQDIDEPRR